MKRLNKTLLAACMLLLVHTSFAQINLDSLLQRQSPSQLDVIGKARTLLVDAFVQSDKEKVQELLLYLSENFDQNSYVTLFPAEKVLLLAWSGDFENMIQFAQEADSLSVALQKKVFPVYANNFYSTVKEKVKQELESILDNLNSSSLTQEEKDFAAIFLRYYLIEYQGTDEDYDVIVSQINTYTRKFIGTYPGSEYIDFLDSFELKPSKWAWAMGLNFGYSVKTGNFAKFFSRSDWAMDCNIDIVYHKMMMTTGILVVSGSVKEDIFLSEDLVLPQKTFGSTINPYLSLGYRFFQNSRLIITPIAGIGTAWINPGSIKEREDNPTLKQFNYSYGLTTNFGLIADFRLGKMKRIPGQTFVEPSFFGIRLSYKFSYNTFKRAPSFYDGNFHTITAGIYLFNRQTIHVKYK